MSPIRPERRRFLRGAAVTGLALSLGRAARAEVQPDAATLAADDLPARIPGLPVLGNPDGDLTIAEFLDYRCGYCRTMQPAMSRLQKEDGRIRLLVMEWPILSSWSIAAAQVALAADRQGKFPQVHAGLFAYRGALDDDALRGVVDAAGVDRARLNADLSAGHDAMIGMFRSVNGAAGSLGFNATPSLLIGGHPIPGALSYEDLKETVAGVRRLAARP